MEMALIFFDLPLHLCSASANRKKPAVVPVTGPKRSNSAARMFPIRGTGLKILSLPVAWGESERLCEGSDVGSRKETFSGLAVKGSARKTKNGVTLNCVDG